MKIIRYIKRINLLYSMGWYKDADNNFVSCHNEKFSNKEIYHMPDEEFYLIAFM